MGEEPVTWRPRWRALLELAMIAGVVAPILGLVGWLALPAPAPAMVITKAAAVNEPRCSHLVSTALAAVDREIPGSYACLAENVQVGLMQGGYEGSDLGLHDFAVDKGRDHIRFIECTPAGTCVYELSGKNAQTLFLFLFVDAAGLVYRVEGEALV